MRRMKRWMIIAATGLVAIAASSAVVFAQTPDGPDANTGEGSGRTAYIERVADKLGIDAEDLESAMKEARAELREERLNARLDALVDAGRISQEEADEIREWVEARPDATEGLFPALKRGHGRPGFHRKGPGHRFEGFGHGRAPGEHAEDAEPRGDQSSSEVPQTSFNF